jgi:pimeloyl-ACP methyl ester carboxylesterase
LSEEPTAPPLVVLVHGTRDEGASFDAVTRELDGIEVVTYDRRGWGPAPVWNGEPATLADHAGDLLALLGERPATVVGHSMGGNVAIAAAIARPDLIASLGVWETAMPWAPWWQGEHPRLIRAAIRRMQEKPPGTSRQNHERRLFLAEATEGLSPSYDLSRLATRTVVGHGTATIPAFGPGMHALAEVIGGEIFSLPGAGHMAHREEPAGFAAFVRQAIATGREGVPPAPRQETEAAAGD